MARFVAHVASCHVRDAVSREGNTVGQLLAPTCQDMKKEKENQLNAVLKEGSLQ
jgi:hypothetical protein